MKIHFVKVGNLSGSQEKSQYRIVRVPKGMN